jgi:hypothetical protein
LDFLLRFLHDFQEFSATNCGKCSHWRTWSAFKRFKGTQNLTTVTQHGQGSPKPREVVPENQKYCPMTWQRNKVWEYRIYVSGYPTSSRGPNVLSTCRTMIPTYGSISRHVLDMQELHASWA